MADFPIVVRFKANVEELRRELDKLIRERKIEIERKRLDEGEGYVGRRVVVRTRDGEREWRGLLAPLFAIEERLARRYERLFGVIPRGRIGRLIRVIILLGAVLFMLQVIVGFVRDLARKGSELSALGQATLKLLNLIFALVLKPIADVVGMLLVPVLKMLLLLLAPVMREWAKFVREVMKEGGLVQWLFKKLFGLGGFVDELFIRFGKMLIDAGTGFASWMRNALVSIGQRFLGVLMMLIAQLWVGLVDFLRAVSGLASGFVSGFRMGLVYIITGLIVFVDWLRNALIGVLRMINDVWSGFTSWLRSGLLNVLGIIIVIWNSFASGLQRGLQLIAGALSSFVELLRGGLANVLNVVVGIWGSFVAVLQGVLAGVLQNFISVWSWFVGVMRDGLANIWNAIVGTWNSFVSSLRGMLDSVIGAIRSVWDGLINALRNLPVVGSFVSGGRSIVSGGGGGIATGGGVSGGSGVTIGGGVSGGAFVGGGTTGTSGAGGGGGLGSIISSIGNAISGAISGIVGGISSVIGSAMGAVRGFFGFQIGGTVKRTGLYVLHAGELVIPAWFVTSLREMVGSLTEISRAIGGVGIVRERERERSFVQNVNVNVNVTVSGTAGGIDVTSLVDRIKSELVRELRMRGGIWV